MDVLTSAEEVASSILKLCLKYPERLEVGRLRPAYGDTQAVTIRVDQEDAGKIGALRSVRIGLAMCRIRERVSIVKCYRCWTYGHMQRD
ncbi:hypothetical protein RI129_003357 [Pyrocoelia pectoralis]|uniref:Uncharacterized protein n=1 Tax=Pyrocoelia pectoralis TaxID=417401 RepID=A0AAN7VI45_9COLE